ncbi:MAG: SDR family oxidoreductase [Gammaproteobacteria bacterium]|nr:SDR family oxidoreductase [Gammaproteobacteria bacterium]
MRLQNRVALVSGAGGPMGMAVAKRFASEGARLVVSDISQSRLDEGVAAIADAAGTAANVVGLRADVSDRAQADAVVAAGRAEFGHIDLLINIVGGWRGRDFDGPANVTEMSEARFDSTLSLNLKPNFYFVQSLAPSMLKREYGKIVNISSINFAGEPGAADYGAAKAAVASLTRTLAMELAPHINVNCIAPGIINTRVVGMLGPELAEEYRQRSLLKRLGEPIDIANAALFLASDESSYITGQVLAVSGGIWPAL